MMLMMMIMQVVLKQPPHHRIQRTKSGRMGKITEDGMNLCIRESRLLWKNFQTELISTTVDIGDQS